MSLSDDRITPDLKLEDLEDPRQLRAVKKISSIFSEALNDDHVHVLVQRPAGALLELFLT